MTLSHAILRNHQNAVRSVRLRPTNVASDGRWRTEIAMNRLWKTTGAINYELLPRHTDMREHERRILARRSKCSASAERACPRICGGGWLEHGERRQGAHHPVLITYRSASISPFGRRGSSRMAAGCLCLPRVPGQLRRAGRGSQPLLGRKALHPHRSGQNPCSLHVRLTLSALAIALCRISRPGALTPRFASSVAAVRGIVGCWLPRRRQTLPTRLVRGRWHSRAGQRRPLGYLRLRAQGATPQPHSL